jgi:hypothetical protein
VPAPSRIAVAVVLALVAGPVALAACGSDSTRIGAAPGYDGDGRPVDTSPFAPAGASSRSGSTTLPERAFAKSTTTTPPPTTTPSVTTIPPPVTPEPGSVRNLCGFAAYISSFYGLSNESPDRAEALVVGLNSLIQRYVDVSPAEVRPDVEFIQAVMGEVSRTLAANGWDPASAAYTAIIQRYASDTGPESLDARLKRVGAAEIDACR